MAGSVLETFYILFASDASEVDEGARDAEKSTDKLEKSLKSTDKAATQTGNTFKDLAKQAVMTLGPFLGLAAIRSAVSNFADTADAAGKLAGQLKIDVEALQAWQGAAVRAGGDADGMTASIEGLNGKLDEMRRGGGGEAAWTFRNLGVSIRDSEGRIKNADKLLHDLAGKFDGLSRQKALKMGERLGLDVGTITLLQKGKKGVEDLLKQQKELGLLTKQDTEVSRKYKNAMADMGQSFGAMSAVVMRLLLPAFIMVADGMTKGAVTIRKHKDLVIGFFIALSTVLGVMALKAGIAFAPFLGIAALILGVAAAFAILYDDVQAFLNGHTSAIGKIAEKYPWVGKLVHGIADAFRMLWDIAKAVFQFLVEAVDNPVRAWANLKKAVGSVVDEFTTKYPQLGAIIAGVFNGIIAVAENWFNTTVSLFSALFDFIEALFSGDLDAILAAGAALFATWLNGIINMFGTFGTAIMGIFDPLWAWVESSFPDFAAWARRSAQSVRDILGVAINWVKEKLDSFLSILPDFVREGLGLGGGGGADDKDVPMPDFDTPTPNAMSPEVAANIAKAQMAIMQTSAPISAMPAGAMGRAAQTEVNRNTSVTVSKVEINTQATDAAGIANGIGGALERELRGAVDNCDDGVAA